MRGFHGTCSASRLVFAESSRRAIGAADVLSDLVLDTDIPHLISSALYGNPRRAFGDGGTGGIAGVETNVPTLAGVTTLGVQEHGDIAVHDVCNENDGIDNSTSVIIDLAALGNGLTRHAADSDDLNLARDLGAGRTLNREASTIDPRPAVAGHGRHAVADQIHQDLGGEVRGQAVVTARDQLAGTVRRP